MSDFPNNFIFLPLSECGVSLTKDRIFGGNSSVEGAYPFYAGVATGTGYQICGGVVINSYWILTAAHCIHNGYVISSPNDITVRPGSYKLNDTEPKKVGLVLVHPQYRGRFDGFRYDIGLLKLKEPLDLENSQVKPVCLPGDGFEEPDNLVAIGMGGSNSWEGT